MKQYENWDTIPPQKQLIAEGIITEKQLRDAAKMIRKELAEKQYRLAIVKKHTEPLIELLKDAEALRYDDSNHYGIHFRIQVDYLHETRQVLRNYFGTWHDEIYMTNCFPDTVDVTWIGTCTDILPCPVKFEIWYPHDDLPKGLLKPGCKIVKTQGREECSIVCDSD